MRILGPACATVACHSTTTGVQGYAFDTVDASRDSLRFLVTPGDPDRSRLVEVMKDRSMPPDTPMSDLDIQLIEQWIADGAEGL